MNCANFVLADGNTSLVLELGYRFPTIVSHMQDADFDRIFCIFVIL